MRIPLIKIRSEFSPEHMTEHLVGTNRHDCLYIHNNGIHYMNIQGMIGTEHPEESHMRFATEKCDIEYSFTGEPEIEFVSVEEFLEILKQELRKEVEDEKEFQRVLPEILKAAEVKQEHDKQLDDLRKSDGYVWHT